MYTRRRRRSVLMIGNLLINFFNSQFFTLCSLFFVFCCCYLQLIVVRPVLNVKSRKRRSRKKARKEGKSIERFYTINIFLVIFFSILLICIYMHYIYKFKLVSQFSKMNSFVFVNCFLCVYRNFFFFFFFNLVFYSIFLFFF